MFRLSPKSAFEFSPILISYFCIIARIFISTLNNVNNNKNNNNTNISQTLRVNSSRILRIKNTKFSEYLTLTLTLMVQGDFQICISVYL